jgi:nucleoside-diphosphate-sugar epimerase
MSGARTLVTGASGFVGRALVRRLSHDGAEVHAVARELPPAAADGARWHAVDLGDETAARELVERVAPATVFHLASLVTGRRDVDLVLPALRANLLTTVNLLVAAQAAGVERVVVAGSMEEPLPGEAPSSPYAAAKGAASAYARMFHALYGLPVVTARIFMVYGPGQRDRSKVVPASILAALAGERPRIGSGSRPIDWIYVDDVVDGLVALAAAPGIAGRTLDLGSGELATVAEVVAEICRQCGVDGPELGAVADRPLETIRRADPDATFAACGSRPRVALADGLARTIAALRAERLSG